MTPFGGTRRELTSLRLAAQHIAHSSFTTPAEVVRHMLAMQAQDFAGAKWAVGLRLPGSTNAAIEASLASGEIVRSWPMRGTLHFVDAQDLWWMLAISATRQKTKAAKRRGDLGITDAELVRAGDIAAREMTGGRSIRRDTLIEAWEADGLSAAGQRAYHLLWNLGQDRLIVFGPVDGKQPTFALFDEWIVDSRRITGDEALAEFATRYFTSHGPATVRDLAWWASITLTDARRAVSAATGLQEREFDEGTYYLAEGLEPAADGSYALPGFDEYILGYQNRSAPLADDHFERIVPGKNGIFLPTVVVDGEVVGTWKRAESATRVVVELVAFEKLSAKARTAFAAAMKRYGEFVGKPVEVRE